MQPSKLGTGVGAPMRRVEDGRFLRGAGRYVDDMPAADATRMVLLRSPHPHARLLRVDAMAARAMPRPKHRPRYRMDALLKRPSRPCSRVLMRASS
jgi:xanthine dehydrogenase molybdopterin-binding subunit B